MAGRKPIPIDLVELEKLCTMQCTLNEIAYWFGVHTETIERAVKREYKCTFSEYSKKKAIRGIMSVKRKIWQDALRGSVPLLIYLDRKHSNPNAPQDPLVSVTVNNTQNNVTVQAVPVTIEDLKQIVREYGYIDTEDSNGSTADKLKALKSGSTVTELGESSEATTQSSDPSVQREGSKP